MKRLIILSVLIISMINGFCQDTTAVVTLKGNQTADQLFKKAKEWYALSFKSANDVIQLSDIDSKTIIAKGEALFNLPVGKYSAPMLYSFTLSTQFKDGRFKYDLTNTRVINKTSGEVITVEEYKTMRTPEGFKEYLKKAGISMVNSEKGAQRMIETYKVISKVPDNLINELTEFLSKDKNNNW